MAIDFTYSKEVDEARLLIRKYLEEEVKPKLGTLAKSKGSQAERYGAIGELRKKAREWGVWLPHMPKEWGGMGLGITAVAAVSAEAVKVPMGPYLINCQAPDEGNMHTLLHFGTDEQKEKFLKPLCEGTMHSAFSMTERDAAGSDPTQIKTKAVRDGDDWVINGRKWFASGAKRANFIILIAKTNENADPPQARNSAFIVPTKTPGFSIHKDIVTMGGGTGHPECQYKDVRVPHKNMLGPEGGGHKLGQVRLGPARLAHCMRWVGQIEMALEMMVDRSQKRFAHGSLLSEKQGIQWMISESALELYASKLMVLHAAYKIENKMEFRAEVSMAKHHVANTLWKVVDRAVQVHGALGYSQDSPLSQMLIGARAARLADGADEVHLMRIADMVMRSYNETGSVNRAVGDLPL